MVPVEKFSVLGSHPADMASAEDSGSWSAADLVLIMGDRRAVFGFRTTDYMRAFDNGCEAVPWADGYMPLPIDRAAVDRVSHWDFNSILWLGPREHPCIVWSNAEGISLLGLSLLLAPIGGGGIFDGQDGRGLPTPEALGIAVPVGLQTYDVAAVAR